MHATSFAGASVSSKRVAFSTAGRCSHVVQAAVAVPAQVSAQNSSSSSSSTSWLLQGVPDETHNCTDH